MDDRKLGCRSLLVLMKLGYDLRAYYEGMIDEELPTELKELSDKLIGYVPFRDIPHEAS